MKTINCKTLCAILIVVLFSTAVIIFSSSGTNVFALEKKLGQDVAGKNCERKDTAESSTFGKCENVCKDKEVTRDAENNRWVCSATKAAGARPRDVRAPLGDKAVAATPKPTPKPTPKRPVSDAKAEKTKKN